MQETILIPLPHGTAFVILQKLFLKFISLISFINHRPIFYRSVYDLCIKSMSVFPSGALLYTWKCRVFVCWFGLVFFYHFPNKKNMHSSLQYHMCMLSNKCSLHNLKHIFASISTEHLKFVYIAFQGML